MSFFSDILILVSCAKLLWDAVVAKTLGWEWFAIGMVGLPFLLGLGGRGTNVALREGVAIAGLIIFFSILSINGFQFLFIALLCIGLLFYLYGRTARRTFRSTLVAIVIFAIIIIFLIRR